MTDSTGRTLTVHKQLELDAPIERVWEAISDRAQIPRWFSDEIRGGPLAAGSGGELVWHAYGAFSFEVEVVDAPHRLRWRWARNPDSPIGKGPWTRVDWTLAELPGGRTRLTLVETGFEDDAARRENDGGWDHELGELRELLQG